MRVVIEHGKTKRVIGGPFNICGSKADLRALEDQLKAARKANPRTTYS